MLRVFDISNITATTLVASSAGYPASGPGCMALIGDYIYTQAGFGGGVQVINVTNPLNPTLVSLTSMPSIGTIISQNKNLYVTNNFLSGTTIPGFSIVNISNITGTTITQIQTSQQTSAIAIRGQYLYVLTNVNTIQIYNIEGAYIQQLEVGGLETDALNVLNNVNIYQNWR